MASTWSGETTVSATAQYILLLAVSVVLTFLVGQLLVRAGEPFLFDVFRNKAVTRSVNLLLSVLFYLITLGVLAIISVLDIGNLENQPLQEFVVRLGIVLLVLGVAYGISMLVLIRIRERRKADEISEHVTEKLAERGVDPRPVTPQE
jgi:cbb3-type cytochrome oxidase subunit 1